MKKKKTPRLWEKQTIDLLLRSFYYMTARTFYGSQDLTEDEIDALDAQQVPLGCFECGCFAVDGACKKPPSWTPSPVTPALLHARAKLVDANELFMSGNTIHIRPVANIDVEKP